MTVPAFDGDPGDLCPDVTQKIARYQGRLAGDPDDLADWEFVRPTALRWVGTARPEDVGQAGRFLTAAAEYAMFAYQTLGATDLDAALTPPLVERYVNHKADRPGSKATSHSSKSSLWWSLYTLGRAVNPDDWPKAGINAGPPDASLRYTAEEEEVHRQSALMPAGKHTAARMITLAMGNGGGARGPEIVAAVPDDFEDLDDGRIAVRLGGRYPRKVPIRPEFTDLVIQGIETHLTEGKKADEQFIPDASTLSYIAGRLGAHGEGGLSLPRSRASWICAHLEAGTPLAALRALAGPMTPRTLVQLLDQTGAAVDEDTALKQGLRA